MMDLFRRREPVFRFPADGARLELLPVEALRAEAAAAGLRAAGAAPSEQRSLRLEHARTLLELAARTGEPEALDRAARAARAVPACAEAVEAALLAAEILGDGALLDAARARLADLPTAADPLAAARRAGLAAALDARDAVEQGVHEPALEAVCALDGAAVALAAASVRQPQAHSTLARVRAHRAELLTACALRLRDPAPAARAAADMADLSLSLDADRLPLSHARAVRLRAMALLVEGELGGDPRRACEAAQLLGELMGELPAEHAPLERARTSRALAHAAAALAEHADDPVAADALSEAALVAFSAAMRELAPGAAPPLRAALALERALHLARTAERHAAGARGAWALARAERALKAELGERDARRDPVAWAAVQVALAKLYAAGKGRRAEAALALDAALEVFAEAGLKGLADTALDALRGLRAQG